MLRGVAVAVLLTIVLAAVVALASPGTPRQGSTAASPGWAEAFAAVWRPAAIGDWIELFGILACAIGGGLLIVARYRTTAAGDPARPTG
jgi:hypothetical protein